MWSVRENGLGGFSKVGVQGLGNGESHGKGSGQ